MLRFRANDAFVGVDPGKSGAAVVLFDSRKAAPLLFPFNNKTPWDIAEFFWMIQIEYLKKDSEQPVFLVEKVHGGGIRGRGRTSGRSMFTFGRSVGVLDGLLVQYPTAEVTPSVWQREFGLTRKAKAGRNAKRQEDDPEKKRRHQAKAQKLFPTQKISQVVADAFLIAAYCRRHYKELF